MIKRGPVEVIYAGTVHPGKYVVLVGGEVASVEEAMAAGRERSGGTVVDEILLPDAHPRVVAAVTGARRDGGTGDALGVVETTTVAAIVGAADRGVKGAEVELREVRLADGLGGKAYCLFQGLVADVEAAVEAAVGRTRPPRPAGGAGGRPPPPRRDARQPRRRPRAGAAGALAPGGGLRMQLGRVVGTVVASVRSPGLDGVKFLLVQPLDRRQDPVGSPVVAADGVAMAGPGELVMIVASREAALALPETFVPVDHAIVGIVDAVEPVAGESAGDGEPGATG